MLHDILLAGTVFGFVDDGGDLDDSKWPFVALVQTGIQLQPTVRIKLKYSDAVFRLSWQRR